ncbi:MAG: AAA family ATPase [Kofleriaceae bacterium]
MSRARGLALHPGGSVRVALGEGARGSDVFRRLALGAARCDLGDEGLYLAEELLGGDDFLDERQREALGHLILAMLTASAQGATRLPLDPRGPARALLAQVASAAGTGASADVMLKLIAGLVRDLDRGTFASILGRPGQRRPLIVDDGHLYLERDHRRERDLAATLVPRLGVGAPDATVRAAVEAVRLRPAGPALDEDQLAAVAAALAGRVTVIVGGPGTGKTALAVALVRGLVRVGATRLALAAPTGKAANRLGEAIASALAGLDEADAADAPLVSTPPTAQTVHRLLGAGPRGFRHGARAPLPVDAVIVDEASMLDLRLAHALLAALPPDARLILLGDADQLPSVEAGQVLADLAAVGADASWCRRLTRSFRMDPTDPDGRAVLEAARAVQAGDAGALLAGTTPRLRAIDPELPPTAPRGATLLDTDDDAVRDRVTAAAFARIATPTFVAWARADHRFDGERFDDAGQAALAGMFAALDRGRVLTATRGLPTGAVAINAQLHELLLALTARSRPTTRRSSCPGSR